VYNCAGRQSVSRCARHKTSSGASPLLPPKQ
jgi:hypothetical protein